MGLFLDSYIYSIDLCVYPYASTTLFLITLDLHCILKLGSMSSQLCSSFSRFFGYLGYLACLVSEKSWI